MTRAVGRAVVTRVIMKAVGRGGWGYDENRIGSEDVMRAVGSGDGIMMRAVGGGDGVMFRACLLYTSPSPRD